ncbi:MAG: HAD family phosphatase [Anaerolineales bacterium]|nr:HAD family phosphatase [Anaerolineales bacterium]
MIRAVIWDLGGVLVRTEDSRSREDLARRSGKTRRELEDLVFGLEAGRRAQLGELSHAEHWEYLRQYFHYTPEEIQAFRLDFFRGDRLDHDLIDYIRSLRGRCKTGLLSNAFSDLRHLVTEVWNIADAFDEMIISAEAGIMKPDPRIYHLALSRLGVEPQEAIFIDDFAHNVDGARAVQMHAIHFKNPAQARAELEALLNGDRA